MRRRFVIFVYNRASRGVASRALKAAGFLPAGTYFKACRASGMPDKPWYEYLSRDAVVREGIDPSYPDPRYIGEATDEEMDRVMAALKKLDPRNQAALEIYHD